MTEREMIQYLYDVVMSWPTCEGEDCPACSIPAEIHDYVDRWGDDE